MNLGTIHLTDSFISIIRGGVKSCFVKDVLRLNFSNGRKKNDRRSPWLRRTGVSVVDRMGRHSNSNSVSNIQPIASNGISGRIGLPNNCCP
jgi:hypothetical protein